MTLPEDNLIGFYASFNIGEPQSELVKSYLWGESGLKNKLISLKWQNYGQDFCLILFQIHTNPGTYKRQHLKEIESYRRKEKAIGISIIIDSDNFFCLSEKERQIFFKQTILRRLDLLAEKIKRNRLDLDLDRLKKDVNDLL